MNDMIKRMMKELIGKKIKVYFKYVTPSYEIRKTGILLEADDKFFRIEEVKDGSAVYSYDFVNAVSEDKE